MEETVCGAGWWRQAQEGKEGLAEAMGRIDEARQKRSEELDLGGLGLVEIPWEVMELTWLRRLHLGLAAQDRAGPGQGGRLPAGARRNRLRAAPSALFWSLTNLELLDLSHNEIAVLPSQIGRTRALRGLWLGGNRLAGLPPEIGRLTALHELWLEHNRIIALPEEIGALQSLQGLSLTGNRLSAVPASIGALQALRGLRIDNNLLTNISPAIGTLDLLQGLWLGGNLLAALPDELGGLRSLQGLWLQNNRLRSITCRIGLLDKLRELRLDGNAIERLPAEIGRLTALRELHCGANRLEALPGEIGALTRLRDLRLEDNRLVDLPSEIGRLRSLQRLWLQGNRLGETPVELLALRSLTELRLERNRIAVLPDSIAALASLRRLSLDHNRLKTLPPRMGRLERLETLTAEGNPLSSPPPDVIAQGVAATLAWLREQEGASTAFFEAKIILVGESGAGKTALLERLLHDRFAAPQPTRGLQLERRVMEHPGAPGAVITLNFWDLGGRPAYRFAQTPFLTPDALYLLVWKACDTSDQGVSSVQPQLEAWLTLLRRRAGAGARVLIVATGAGAEFAQQEKVIRNARLFARRHGDIVIDCLAVDNETGQGARELWRAVRREAVKLDAFGAPRPESWTRARDAVLARLAGSDMGLMPASEFDAIALRNGVCPDETPAFAAMLANQGRIVCGVPDGGRTDAVAGGPEQVMQALADVLADEGIRANGGVFVSSEGRSDGAGDREARTGSLRLLARWGFAFQWTERAWAVPALFPERPPVGVDGDGFEGVAGDGGGVSIERVFDDVSPDLMALFIARNHALVEEPGRCWRHGAVFRDRRFAAEALVTATVQEARKEGVVRIVARGPFAGSFARRLVRSLDLLARENCPETEVRSGPGVCSAAAQGSGGGTPQSADATRFTLDERFADAAKGAPPRLYSLAPADAAKWDAGRLASQKVQVTVWCEETFRPVKAASAIVTLSLAWLKLLREHGAALKALLAAVSEVASFTDEAVGDCEAACRSTAEIVEAALRFRIGDDPGADHPADADLLQAFEVPPSIAETLRRAAWNGGIVQTRMDGDGRWLWVCPEAARRNDRCAPKL